jgi:FkbM family methyltransferase
MALDTSTAFGTYHKHRYQRLLWAICDAPLFSSSLRRKLRKKFSRQQPGPYDVEFAGINWRLYPEENYCDRVIFARKTLPEMEEHNALLPHIKPGMTFIDIGANIGSYSLFVAHHSNNEARIVALEPHPKTFQKLQFNLKANGVENATPLQLASGPERTTMQLWSDGGSNIGHTSILKEGTSNAKLSVDVNVLPLVDILAEQDICSIDLLKIDIEGFEDQVLTPFFENSDKHLWPRLILIETAHQSLWKSDLIGWMKGAGYKTIFQTKENLLLSL